MSAVAMTDQKAERDALCPVTCRRCQRPADLHCPGCNTCWPDHTCAVTCDAEPEEVAAAAEAVDQWEEAHAQKVTAS